MWPMPTHYVTDLRRTTLSKAIKCGQNQARKKGLSRASPSLYLQPCCVITAQVHLRRKLHAVWKRSNKQAAHAAKVEKREQHLPICWNREELTLLSFPPCQPSLPSSLHLFFSPSIPISRSSPLTPSLHLRPSLMQSYKMFASYHFQKDTTYLDGSQGCPPGCTCFCFHLP